ncbi:DUF771 domain-containing protein [Liquorilactobacillus mali]|uniref:DUF771 domain-containing protein n=1 Tax=Liquorilactobacillus mali KCTC 3596 = DSM 20444 TaxID=1046596 RepID=J1F618_9LACO|nr:DUF771 domain-containing protein [Liquorilactobacillus mali]EJF02148.1 hypothetical protein LMA_00150 [Liquorilactobacillus mali KCTC 3596 = DSM 20444]KRN02885.1 hypothetical protein FD00_GL000554 [Liquorilactobacillus mali KCTC 3596 = DSM 20444]MDV7758229.1 DUF771 domain-containing protein [Liquorilactobacillus mali]QFQ74545.1 DUF771 domain-containing protein [Liquorilactobacillus mali]
MQQLQATVTIPVPEGKTLIDNVDLKEIKDEIVHGKTWSLMEFKRNCCFNRHKTWVLDNILYAFRDEIEYKDGKGWCIFSKGRGSSYQIRAEKACDWMEENFDRIDWNAKIPK